MTRTNLQRQIAQTSDDPTIEVSLTVNGERIERAVSVRMLLSDFLRHELRLTGTHVGCEHGICGCCTVLIDGKSARSCLTLVAQAQGAEVTTIEALAAQQGELHAIQQAFKECHALQCGFCTPGMIMNIFGRFNEPQPLDLSDEGIRTMLSGNLCRCTGYTKILQAVELAAREAV
jgi:aerobic-type carbon monoxide dehydrogenase small subunit (CoxS/CutS family)